MHHVAHKNSHVRYNLLSREHFQVPIVILDVMATMILLFFLDLELIFFIPRPNFVKIIHHTITNFTFCS